MNMKRYCQYRYANNPNGEESNCVFVDMIFPMRIITPLLSKNRGASWLICEANLFIRLSN